MEKLKKNRETLRDISLVLHQSHTFLQSAMKTYQVDLSMSRMSNNSDS